MSIHGTVDTLTALARQAAFTYLENHYADATGNISLPVDPVSIATSAGVHVSVASLHDASGVLVHDSESTRMFIERENESWIAAFVAAELLGRHIYNEGGSRYGFVSKSGTLFTTSDRADEDEFSERFSYELLIPGSTIRKYWSENKSIKWIAKRFGFPEGIIETRLYMLGF